MALSDCYVLKDFQLWRGETLLNVYFYQDLLLASIAQNVVESWTLDVLPKVLATQANVCLHTRVECVNLADKANFFEAVTNLTGTQNKPCLPSHDAMNYTLKLNSRALRPGSRRISGIPEQYTTDNVVADSEYIAVLEPLRVQYHTILKSDIVDTFQPIVVKRVRYNPDPLRPDHWAYRLPESDSEFVFGNVIEVLLNLNISHQVSRGNGR